MTMRALSPLWGVGASGGVAATNPSRRAPGGCDTAEMVAFISHTSIDCRNAYTLSVWWEGVLDYVPDPDDPNEPGHEECLIRSRDGSHTLLFIEAVSYTHLDVYKRQHRRCDVRLVAPAVRRPVTGARRSRRCRAVDGAVLRA